MEYRWSRNTKQLEAAERGIVWRADPAPGWAFSVQWQADVVVFSFFRGVGQSNARTAFLSACVDAAISALFLVRFFVNES